MIATRLSASKTTNAARKIPRMTSALNLLGATGRSISLPSMLPKSEPLYIRATVVLRDGPTIFALWNGQEFIAPENIAHAMQFFSLRDAMRTAQMVQRLAGKNREYYVRDVATVTKDELSRSNEVRA